MVGCLTLCCLFFMVFCLVIRFLGCSVACVWCCFPLLFGELSGCWTVLPLGWLYCLALGYWCVGFTGYCEVLICLGVWHGFTGMWFMRCLGGCW